MLHKAVRNAIHECHGKIVTTFEWQFAGKNVLRFLLVRKYFRDL